MKNAFFRAGITRPTHNLTLALLAGSLAFTAPLAAQNIDLSDFDVTATANGFAILGANNADSSGSSVSGAGDVNGDGYADIVIGARSADGPADSRPFAGDSYVIFGKASGFTNIDLASLDSGATADGFAILGANGYDFSGHSVSGAGDVNGDGYADIIIGARGGDGPSSGRPNAGHSYVIFGKASGFTNIDLAGIDSGATVDGFAILGANSFDYSGVSVSGAGDVNGDGYTDLLIGAYRGDASGNSRYNSGDTYVLFGKPSGFTNIDLASLDSGATADGFAILGANNYDNSGFSVSGAGDVNGDGYADVLIGAYAADGPGNSRSYAGDSYVLFGKATGFTNVDLATLDSGATADGFAILGANARDFSARRVSGAGDINGDGYADIIIGATGADGPGDGRPYSGDSYVLFGKATGFTNIDLATFNGGSTADGFAILGANNYDNSGTSVSGAGDVNGDGYADILISATTADGQSDSRSYAGDSYILFGKSSGFTNFDLASLDSGATVDGFTIIGANNDDRCGDSLSGAGDVNGDGYADFIISAAIANSLNDGRPSAGDSYVIFGKGSATSATYRSFARIGDAPRIAVGITGDGSNDSTPDSRSFIDFADGDNLSLQTVTLTRNNAAIQNLPNAANVMWQVETDRTGWSRAVTCFNYTDAEIAGLDEGKLTLYIADSPSGPWNRLAKEKTEPNRNQVCGVTNHFSYFAVAEKSNRARIEQADGTFIVVESPSGTVIDFVRLAEPDPGLTIPVDAAFPEGLIDVQISGGPVGGSIPVTVTYENRIAGPSYADFFVEGSTDYVPITPAAAVNDNGTTVTVQILISD